MKNAQDYLMLEQVLKSQLPKKDTRYLPTFDCKTCGNCEKNYFIDEPNADNGFCFKFFQNVALDEKNVACWTSKPHTHFEDLSKLRPTEIKKDDHIRNKRAKKLKIQLDQPTLF